MNVQPWAMYTPQAYQPYPLAGFLGGIAPGTGGGQLAPQSLMSNLFSGLAGFPGHSIGGQFGYPPVNLFGYPPVGQFGQPPISHTLGSLGGLLPFHAVPGMIPGVWGGPLAAQFTPQGLFGTPFGQGAGLLGQGIGGQFGYPPISLFGYPPVGQFGQLPLSHTFGSLNSQLGYPQASHTLGNLGNFLPFSATPGMIPGLWGGQPPYLGGQWSPYGLNLLSGLAGHSGQGISGLPPFQATPGMATVA